MAKTDAQRVTREQCEKAVADVEVERTCQAKRTLVVAHAHALTSSLQAQAIVVQSIHALVPIVLNHHSA
jgi:hypothetical protein